MSAALAISKREIRTYFNSPVAYIVVTVYLALTGALFFGGLMIEKQAEMRAYFQLTPLFFCFIVPAITMRLIAEEKNSGSIEMLITLPVRDWEVVVGKYLAAVALVGAMVGTTLVYAFSVGSVGELDSGATYSGYFGLMLMGGAFAAIGIMSSALTKNQIVAYIIALGISFALFLCGKMAAIAPEALRPLMSFLSIDEHFNSIARGVIDTRDVLYYVSVITACLMIATVSLESRKWK